jgi:hypothetical protein
VAVTDARENVGEVKCPCVEGACQRDRAAHLARDGGDVVPGGLDGLEDPLGARLERRPVLGQRDRRDAPVEQRHPELPLQPGDRARHGRLDDVGVAGGSGEAAGLTTRQEIFQVADVHGVMLGPINAIDCVVRKQPLDSSTSPVRWLFMSLYFHLRSNSAGLPRGLPEDWLRGWFK